MDAAGSYLSMEPRERGRHLGIGGIAAHGAAREGGRHWRGGDTVARENVILRNSERSPHTECCSSCLLVTAPLVRGATPYPIEGARPRGLPLCPTTSAGASAW